MRRNRLGRTKYLGAFIPNYDTIRSIHPKYNNTRTKPIGFNPELTVDMAERQGRARLRCSQILTRGSFFKTQGVCAHPFVSCNHTSEAELYVILEVRH